jgi:SAM-dependent methyltransferase
MYELIKKILTKLVSNSFLFRHELKFRYFTYLFYKGKSFSCNICNARLNSFVKNENQICPKCGSISRERRLWEIISSQEYHKKTKILDFSPSRALYRKLKKLKGENYIATDLSGDFLSNESYDITKIDSEDATFDLIICYHILEHIIEDEKAMKELNRVLNTDGICIIQTPFKSGDVYEDYNISSPEERLKAFGQNDHVRIYSVEALISRLEKSKFIVKKLEFNEIKLNKNGFKENETVLICNK